MYSGKIHRCPIYGTKNLHLPLKLLAEEYLNSKTKLCFSRYHNICSAPGGTAYVMWQRHADALPITVGFCDDHRIRSREKRLGMAIALVMTSLASARAMHNNYICRPPAFEV
jgi:hypothetical protein